ncbi:Alpha/Beta hydrolase protein [Calycina marina]|uniref:Alpha/Beta hydrolase protein n=1 Tax=Calycina marina TaxID=1763456 RepID=A0A9P7Z8L4_9HELO|nr:Alpha/Beta hydrolase protein [Calycina marina]
MAKFKPPYDPELLKSLAMNPGFPPFASKEILDAVRDSVNQVSMVETTMTDPEISHEEVSIPGPGGKLALSIVRLKKSVGGPRPIIYFMHPGGLILGDKLLCIQGTFDWIKENDAVVVSVDYRLAPEHPYPAQINDCEAGLKWVISQASELKIDLSKLILAGMSAGGGLAAALALKFCNEGGPKVLAQCLIWPMLDDKMETASTKQFMDATTWSGANSIHAMEMVIPGLRGTEGVPIYAFPARATDLTKLPQAFVDVGGAEMFRDEDVEYASRMAAAGVSVELHVWPGAYHGSDVNVPSAMISQTACATRAAWLKRILTHAEKAKAKL